MLHNRRWGVAELDAVSRDPPVVLISGDADRGWLNSPALAWFGLPAREGVDRRRGVVPLFQRLGEFLGAAKQAESGCSMTAAGGARGLTRGRRLAALVSSRPRSLRGGWSPAPDATTANPQAGGPPSFCANGNG